MRLRPLSLLLTAALALPAAALAQTSSPVPDALQASCDSCHAPAAQAASHAPRLNGQTRDYLVARLKGLRNPGNQTISAIHNMLDPARAVTESQIQALAGHYAAQAPDEPNRRGPAHDRGAQLYARGRGDTIPPCAGCHGDKGQGVGEAARLAGQHGAYLQDQIEALMIAARVQGEMNKHVWTLNPEDVRALVAYLGNG
jgi:cytochrome c553